MPKACKMFFNYQTIGPKGRRSGWSGYKLYSKDNGVVLSRCKVLPRVRQRQFYFCCFCMCQRPRPISSRGTFLWRWHFYDYNGQTHIRPSTSRSPFRSPAAIPSMPSNHRVSRYALDMRYRMVPDASGLVAPSTFLPTYECLLNIYEYRNVASMHIITNETSISCGKCKQN